MISGRVQVVNPHYVEGYFSDTTQSNRKYVYPIQYLCYISLDKKLHGKECSGGISHLFATQGLGNR